MRITEDQAELLFGSRPPGTKKPRVKKPREQLPENQIEAQITQWLACKGWSCTKRHTGTFVAYYAAMEAARGKPLNHASVVRMGTAGEADWHCTRPYRSGLHPGLVEAFDLEVKAPGVSPNNDQLHWIAMRNKLGYLATWADGLARFQRWYCERWPECDRL